MPGPAATASCGTVSAYKRHLRHGELPDEACRLAWAAYHRARYKPAGTPPAETQKENSQS